MAKLLYISDETKEKLERLAKLETRKLNDEVLFLCDQRLKELSVRADADASMQDSNITTPEKELQEQTT